MIRFITPAIIILALLSCQNRQKEDSLPSSGLVDSVIIGAINSFPLNVFKYSENEVDSLIKIKKWSPSYALNSALSDWEIAGEKSKDSSLEFKTHAFDFGYINQRLYKNDNLKLFNPQDSSYMFLQINNHPSDTLNLTSYAKIWYTNPQEINRKSTICQQDTNQHFFYCEFSQPLFDLTKTKAILGLSIFDIVTNHQGSVYLIMTKKEDDWIMLTDIDWWGH